MVEARQRKLRVAELADARASRQWQKDGATSNTRDSTESTIDPNSSVRRRYTVRVLVRG